MFEISKHEKEIQELCGCKDIFEKFRLVDPVTSLVYYYENGKAVPYGNEVCYNIWGRSERCENCVSLRCCTENKKCFKIEYLDGAALMVCALPIIVEGHQFSLELVTDASGNIIIQDPYHNNQKDVLELINEITRLAVTDVFTGLYNNTFIKNKVISLSQNPLHIPFSILVIDIDQFKTVNDTYGHMAGDIVIQTIADELKAFFNKDNFFVGRMGGDEYCVVLENCLLSEAQKLSDEILNIIQRHIFTANGQDFSIYLSTGLGEFSCEEDAFDFINRVDSLLYTKKNNK